MRKFKYAMLALAAGLMFQGAAVQPASALPVAKPAAGANHGVKQVRHFNGRHMGGRPHIGVQNFNSGRHFDGRHHGFRRHHFYGPRFYVAPVYSYSYHSNCRWLKRKALYTGSSYWWHRYKQCRYDW